MDVQETNEKLKKAEQRGGEYRPPLALDGLWIPIAAGLVVLAIIFCTVLAPMAIGSGYIAGGLQWDGRPAPALIDVVFFGLIAACLVSGIVGAVFTDKKGEAGLVFGIGLLLFIIWEGVSA